MSRKPKDLTGQIKLNYKVLSRVEDHIYPSGKRDAKWLCKCQKCGAERRITSKDLSRPRTVCKHKKKSYKTPGGTSHPEYRLWANMKERCINHNHKDYKNYGARGITVCNRWINSFDDFIKDMGARPTPQHTIERQNVEGNYEPSNCIWLLKSLQRRTQRNVVLNEELVRYIRLQRDTGARLRDVIKELGFKRATIAAVWYNNSWKDVN